MLRVTDNPIVRFPLNRPLADDFGRWEVARVKPRQEKALARDLERRQISYYLPLVEKRVRRRDNNKPRKSWVPLFPGYLALAAGRDARTEVLSTGRVAGLIEVVDQDLLVCELTQIQRTIESGATMVPQTTFQPGQPVRVQSGPLQGLLGEVVRAGQRTQFVIRVHMFSQAVSVEIDEAFLEAM